MSPPLANSTSELLNAGQQCWSDAKSVFVPAWAAKLFVPEFLDTVAVTWAHDKPV
jgi:hypothetical protein